MKQLRIDSKALNKREAKLFTQIHSKADIRFHRINITGKLVRRTSSMVFKETAN